MSDANQEKHHRSIRHTHEGGLRDENLERRLLTESGSRMTQSSQREFGEKVSGACKLSKLDLKQIDRATNPGSPTVKFTQLHVTVSNHTHRLKTLLQPDFMRIFFSDAISYNLVR
ncbi:hypothetical protein Mapa_001139 [Marchantia paleacea]|nr:hypothetical protein Mapa_001139 [Marchantia paleacea]